MGSSRYVIITIMILLSIQIVSFSGTNFENQAFAVPPPGGQPAPIVVYNPFTDTVTLTWGPVSATPAVTDYRIFRSTAGGAVGTFILDGSVGNATTTAYIDSTASLADGVSVVYIYRPINADSIVPNGAAPENSLPSIAFTTYTPSVPDAITDLSLTVDSSTSVTLNWSVPDDNGTPITSYNVYRNLNGGGYGAAISNPVTNTFTDNILSPEDSVTYRIEAISAAGTSPLSNEPAPVVTSPLDTDGDGIYDTSDNCPNISNTNQLDTDLDGVGDACETPDQVFFENFDGSLDGWSVATCVRNHLATQTCIMNQITNLWTGETPNSLPNWGFVEINALGGGSLTTPIQVAYQKSFTVFDEDDYNVNAWLGTTDCESCNISTRLFIDGVVVAQRTGVNTDIVPPGGQHKFFEHTTLHLTPGTHYVAIGMYSTGAISGHFRAFFDDIELSKIIPDLDGDTIADILDNCPLIPNLDQLDTDSDDIGDVCDSTPNGDSDYDGIDNLTDNCPVLSNADQLDTDSDTIGDACDQFPLDPQNDIDGDLISGEIDNCPLIANSNQSDIDSDSLGDVCDFDDDNDSILDDVDSCPTEPETINNYQDTDGCPDIALGSITITKDTNPNNAQNFGFVTTGGLTPVNFVLDDDTDATISNTRTFSNITFGTYTVSENLVPGFRLTNLVCNDPDNGTTISLTTRRATIDLDPGENITCTFTNTQTGTITIIKDTNPNNAQNFGFVTVGLTPINFSLDDDSDPTLPSTRVYSNVLPGSYPVTENIVSGYRLTGLSCVDPDNGTTTSIPTRKATIDLDSGESITCTFTNTRTGTITIIEDSNPNSPQNFIYTTTGGLIPINFSLDDDTDAVLPNFRVYSNIPIGSYSVTQNIPAGFTLTGLSCVDPDNGSTVNLATRVSTIDLDAGESITCTYTNTAN